MGDVNVTPGGGSGVDSDNATASAADILSGKTAGIAGADEPVAGTMPNNGAWRGAAAMNSSVAIPRGYHSGAGGVSGPSIPYQNAEVDGDRAYATNISCGPGQINLGVRNGHYLNGVNWIKGSFPTLTAANIKKGVNIGGVVGTWEGYVSPINYVEPFTDQYNQNLGRITQYSASGTTSTLYNGASDAYPDRGRGLGSSPSVSISVQPAATVGQNPGVRWSGGYFNNAIIVTGFNYVAVRFCLYEGAHGTVNSPMMLSVALNADPKTMPQTGPNATLTYYPKAVGSDSIGNEAYQDETLVFNISNITGWQYLILYACNTRSSNYSFRLYIKEIRFYS